MKKDTISIRVERSVYKKLQKIKIDKDKKTISDVIDYLLQKKD